MSQLPLRVLYYGKDEPLPEQTQLRAGPLSTVFEAGDLRYIRFGDHEILRRVYVAVRDHNWDTILPQPSNVQIERDSNAFRIAYDVENKHGEVDFFWQGTITGDADGTITFSMDGEARSTFRRNRIGFCVLHPMGLAGLPCRIEKVDGAVEESAYPISIAPQHLIDGEIKPVAPFNNMRAVRYEVTAGVEAEVRFEGEIFEMEDQRNWTDASYKTYGTPLSEPFPVEVPAGTKISQRITVTLKTQRESSAEKSDASTPPLTLEISSADLRPLPRIGLGVASHGEPLSTLELERLKLLNPSHLRADIDLTQPDYESGLRQATDEAGALGVSLELALFLTDAAEKELQAFAEVVEQVKPPIGTYLIFHKTEASTSAQWVDLARRYLTGAKIGAGSNAYFTDLNRGHPPVDALDLVCYSINPQVHAFDNSSLIETLEAQAVTVESTRQFTDGLPITVTPVTLLARFNPNATGPEPEPAPGELPAQVDIRQMSLFGAGWTLGSIKYLSESSASSVTYYETSGWRGVMETATGSPLPEKFRSLPGGVFPLYHILADVGEFAGGEVLVSKSSDPLKVEGVALRKNGKTRTLLANLTPEPQQVNVQNLSDTVRVRHLNETNAHDAMASPETFRAETGELLQTTNNTLELNLLPYAIAQIDSN
ncbi:hypothetical protein F4X33_07100 [Candidatus Poribacteria bacterium]|nr:hypothetical protein [Candidatus Poribacteria bacterium]